jgi:hypothetical protein
MQQLARFVTTQPDGLSGLPRPQDGAAPAHHPGRRRSAAHQDGIQRLGRRLNRGRPRRTIPAQDRPVGGEGPNLGRTLASDRGDVGGTTARDGAYRSAVKVQHSAAISGYPHVAGTRCPTQRARWHCCHLTERSSSRLCSIAERFHFHPQPTGQRHCSPRFRRGLRWCHSEWFPRSCHYTESSPPSPTITVRAMGAPLPCQIARKLAEVVRTPRLPDGAIPSPDRAVVTDDGCAALAVSCCGTNRVRTDRKGVNPVHAIPLIQRATPSPEAKKELGPCCQTAYKWMSGPLCTTDHLLPSKRVIEPSRPVLHIPPPGIAASIRPPASPG